MGSTTRANPQSLNLYAYCTNDPVNHTDPNGLGFFSWLKNIFKKIIGALIAAFVAVVVTMLTGGNLAAGLKVGWLVFKASLSPSMGFTPSGGWGRTPPFLAAAYITASTRAEDVWKGD